MDPAAIRNALAVALRTVEYTAGRHLEASGYAPDSIDPPWAYPAGSAGTYDDTMDATSGVTQTIRVLTSRAEDRSGQELLDAMLADSGPASIKAAIEADPTLGGLVNDLAVTGWDGYRPYDVSGTDYYGAEITVEILA